LVDAHQTGAHQPGVPFGSVKLSGVVPRLFSPFNPSLNSVKFHLNSRVALPQGGLTDMIWPKNVARGKPWLKLLNKLET